MELNIQQRAIDWPSLRKKPDGTWFWEGIDVEPSKGPMIEAQPYNHSEPPHYKGDIECIDYQKSVCSPEEFRGYLRCCALKYIHRMYSKDTPTTNIDKALWYLNRLKKELDNV